MFGEQHASGAGYAYIKKEKMVVPSHFVVHHMNVSV
jgi:hypothetical protein